MRIGLWLLFAGLLILQLFVPPFIGLANNADFGKVAGWLSLAPVDGWDSNFVFFQPDWIRHQRDYWRSPYYSSETVLAWLAATLSGATAAEGAHFDIRVLGAIHAAFLLAAMGIAVRWRAVAVAAILAFGDVCYIAYCNSFYMDAAAMCSLLLMVAAAAWMAVTERPTVVQFLVYGFAGLVFVTSKTQHAIWFLLVTSFLAMQCRRGPRIAGALIAAVLLCAAGLELGTAEPSNRAQALFNKIFFQLGPMGADLRELGVRPEEMRLVGTHSYMPGSPALDRPWVNAFYARTGYGRLLVWYLRHPGGALRVLNQTLRTDAPAMRSENLSNYRREDGHPAGARTDRFAGWSGIRSAMLARWPYLVAVWYVVFVAGCIRGRGRAGGLAHLALGVAVLGAGEFLVAALADCLETGRHLFLFHVCTDLTICFAVAAVVSGSLKTCVTSSSVPSSRP